MRDIKYLAFGLVLGILIAALGAVAVFVALPAARAYSSAPSATAPAPTASFTATATAPPTETPAPPSATPTPVPSPTATLEPVQALIQSGGLTFTGPLTNAQQVDLYKASLNYARSNSQDSQRVAEQINGVGYGDASNICGPLAIAILRDAGLLPATIVPHDFWLLDPYAATDARRLNDTFPFEWYAYFKTLTPINKMDWRTSPLLPGDFLFIWHGSGGNFDHMLVVNRVDKDLRAYAVTNFGTPEGFLIDEAMLYDPSDPNAGLFHTWTREQDAILGSTGFGGFETWRRRGEP